MRSNPPPRFFHVRTIFPKFTAGKNENAAAQLTHNISRCVEKMPSADQIHKYWAEEIQRIDVSEPTAEAKRRSEVSIVTTRVSSIADGIIGLNDLKNPGECKQKRARRFVLFQTLPLDSNMEEILEMIA
jgi:hypothetical protein